MTNDELQALYETNSARSRELEAMYRAGFSLTRQERLEFSACVRRIGVVATELWVAAGKPAGFEILERDEIYYRGLDERTH